MPSREENLFAKIAVETGFLTQDQVDEAVRALVDSRYPRPLAVILVEKGFLTDEEVARVLDLQMRSLGGDDGARKRKRKEDDIFGQLVVKRGLATRDQVESAVNAQADLDERGIFRRLGQVFVELDILRPAQVEEILDYQRKKILVCDACFAQFTICDFSQGRRYRCKRCRTILAIPSRLYTVEVVGTIEGWKSDEAEEELSRSFDLIDEPAAEPPRPKPVPAEVRAATAAPGGASVALIGKIAVRKGLVTQETIDRVLQVQLARRARGDQASLGELLVEEGYLSRADLDAIVDEQTRSLKATDPVTRRRIEDVIFGKLVVKHGLASPEAVHEALRIQAEREHREGRYVRLGRVLVDTGALTHVQVVRLLEAQMKKILVCESCTAQYNIANARPGKTYRCKRCGRVLSIPTEVRSIDVEGTLYDED